MTLTSALWKRLVTRVSPNAKHRISLVRGFSREHYSHSFERTVGGTSQTHLPTCLNTPTVSSSQTGGKAGRGKYTVSGTRESSPSTPNNQEGNYLVAARQDPSLSSSNNCHTWLSYDLNEPTKVMTFFSD